MIVSHRLIQYQTISITQHENGHIRTAEAIIAHASVFEQLLKLDKGAPSPSQAGIAELEKRVGGLNGTGEVMAPGWLDGSNPRLNIRILTSRLIGIYSHACYYCGRRPRKDAGGTKQVSSFCVQLVV